MSKNDILTDQEKSKLCMECQWCCKWVFLPLAIGPNYLPFYKGVRGMDIKFHNFNPWLVLYAPCQHITPEGCAIYKNRPEACKDFDGRKMIFYSDKCLWKGKGD